LNLEVLRDTRLIVYCFILIYLYLYSINIFINLYIVIIIGRKFYDLFRK